MHISIIIPALNEEQAIGETLASVAREKPCEVIVADGGSQDRTCEIASRYATVLTCAPGRARQMNAGARRAAGDVFLFLHADTQLPVCGLAKVAEALGAGACAGRFRMRFDRPHPLLAFYAFQTRFHFFSYGDQGFFVRRDLFGELGGFREDVPFEDIDFYSRLSKVQKPVILKEAVVTSARRFSANGLVRQKCMNMALASLYYLGWPAERLASLKEKWYPDIR